MTTGVPGHPDARDARAARIVVHLDRLMLERNVSLMELSRQVGITPANLSKIKNNRINAIRFSTLAAICRALRCQPGDLIEYVD